MKLELFQKLSPRSWALTLMVVTAFVGAVFVYVRTITIEQQKFAFEREKFIFEQRRYSYAEFFESTAQFWLADYLDERATKEKEQSRRTQLQGAADEARRQYNLLWRKARMKIAVLSEADVVNALADYFGRSGSNIIECSDDKERWLKDAAIYKAIRSETYVDGDVTDKAMVLVMFDCLLSK